MRTKLQAARIAQDSGCSTIIAGGTGERPIAALLSGKARATIVTARLSPASAYKAWIAGSLAPDGRIQVDEGAIKALRAGSSLLPSGVTAIDGDFSHGASVVIVGTDGVEAARGLVRYGATEARAIIGRRASDIEAILGYSRGDELIHRDDLVMK
jgi:glutamate 5-kinase